ncbi:MAG: Flp pilus assembly protein CpaB [Acidobacteria bacterium]|nr:Flp pilus assembly protein CpaB [Acidobacteriota bacterium]
MNRSARTITVVGISLVMALAASFLVYRTIKAMPAREVEVAHVFAVVAARPLTVGTLVAEQDVKLVAWPASNPVGGGFDKIADVVSRGIVSPVAENQPLTSATLAPREAGAGLPPTIPTGMRAISVKVNEVIGVAGFVVPGTRVDVLVVLGQVQASGSLARVVVSNVQVLAAGTKYDQDVVKDGEAIPSSVVTLMVTPEDAERIALASTEGQILLTLRNPLDNAPTSSPGVRTTNLITGQSATTPPAAAPAPAPVVRRAPAPKPAAAAPAAAPPPPPPPIYTVETIRAAQRSQETLK